MIHGAYSVKLIWEFLFLNCRENSSKLHDKKQLKGGCPLQDEGRSKRFRDVPGGICLETWQHSLRFSRPFSVIPDDVLHIADNVYFPILPTAFNLISLEYYTASLVYQMQEQISAAVFETHSFQQNWHRQAYVFRGPAKWRKATISSIVSIGLSVLPSA